MSAIRSRTVPSPRSHVARALPKDCEMARRPGREPTLGSSGAVLGLLGEREGGLIYRVYVYIALVLVLEPGLVLGLGGAGPSCARIRPRAGDAGRGRARIWLLSTQYI